MNSRIASILIALLFLDVALFAAGRTDLQKTAASKAEEMARINWIEGEKEFALALGQKQYLELAQKVLDDVAEGDLRIHQKALNGEERKLLKVAEARIKIMLIRGHTDAAVRRQLGAEAVETMKEVVGSVAGDSPVKLSAEQSLMSTYVELGELFIGDWERTVDKEARLAAGRYFAAAVTIGTPVLARYSDAFSELYEEYMAASRKEQRQMKPAVNKALFLRVRNCHLMERAYFGACLAAERGTPECRKMVNDGQEFIEGLIWDYELVPWDKEVYWHWFRILSCEDDGRTTPRYNEDMLQGPNHPRPPEYFTWNSDRARHIFETHFVRPQEGGISVSAGQKNRALYYMAKSWVRFARGAHQRAKKINDRKKRDAMREHARRLEEECARYVNDIVRKRLTIVGVENRQVFRLSGRLNIKSEFHIFLAEKAKDAGDMEGAKQEMERALAECGKVSVEGGERWRQTVQNRIETIQKHALRITGEELHDVNTLIARADTLYRQARGERKDEKRQLSLFGQAMDAYREACGMMKGRLSADPRTDHRPRIWERIASCALKLKDFDLAYIYLFEIVQNYNYRHYDLAQDPAMNRRVRFAAGNLKYAANKMLRHTRNEMTAELYIDVLRMAIYADKNVKETVIISLIDELKRAGRFDDAIELIAAIPSSHSYYTLSRLMAADIWGRKKKRTGRQVLRLEKSLAAEENRELQAKLKKEIRETQALAEESGRNMVKSADEFLKHAMETITTPKPGDREAAAVWEGIVSQIPAAYLVGISNLFTSRKYAEVVEKVDAYMEKIAPFGAIGVEARNACAADAQWMRFLSLLQGTDAKTASYDRAEAAFKLAGESIKVLEKYSDARRYPSSACIHLGLAWIALGQRARDEAGDMPDGIAKVALLSRSNRFSRLGADTLGRTGGIAYKDLNIMLTIGRIYSQLEMYDKAAEIYDRGIQFWGESLYTPDHLFLKGKCLADLVSAGIPGDILGSLDGVIDISEIRSAADNAAVIKVLNQAIKSFNPKALGEKTGAIFKAAALASKDDRELLDSIRAAKSLLGRSDIATSSMLKQKIARTVLECVFPGILTRSKPIPVIIAEDEFSNVIKGVVQKYPPTRIGRIKGAIIKGMSDPSKLSGRDSDVMTERGRVAAFRSGMRKEIDNPNTTSKRKSQLLSYESLFDPGLAVYLYGVLENGKLKRRNFPRARQHIMRIINFDRNMLPLPESEFTEMPLKDFFIDISDSLTFSASIIQARRHHARALARIGRYREALALLEKLIEYSPDDTELLLAKASVYTSIGARLGRKNYDADAAGHFMRSRMQAKYVRDRTREGSDIHWESTVIKIENEAEEVLARTKHGKGKVDIRTPVMVFYKPYGSKNGHMVEVKMQTPPILVKQAKALLVDLVRILELGPPEDAETRLRKVLARLLKAGYIPAAPVPKPKRK